MQACNLLNESLGRRSLANASQAYRLIDHFGNLEAVAKELQTPLQEQERLELPATTDEAVADEAVADEADKGVASEVNYAMFDGGMLPYDDGYHEVKVGRLFQQSQIVLRGRQDQENKVRHQILNSEYLVCEGHYENFIAPFGKLMEQQQQLRPEAKLVVITDGATWMHQWIEEQFPEATHILDFYHAFEHLCDFASVLIPEDAQRRRDKREAWKEQLHQGQLEELIREVKMYLVHSCQKVQDQAASLLTYLTNNRNRMDYKAYRDEGLLIGSGAIESAVSTVVQQRCKLRGQRWKQGAKPVMNLRAMYYSRKGKRMERIILSEYSKAA